MLKLTRYLAIKTIFLQLLCVHGESQAARHRLRIAQRRRAVDEVMTVCTQDAHDTIFRFARDVNNVRLMAIEFRSSSVANGPATERDLSLMSQIRDSKRTTWDGIWLAEVE